MVKAQSQMNGQLLSVVHHLNGLFTVMIVAVTGCCGRQCGNVPANKHSTHSLNWIQSLEYESMTHDGCDCDCSSETSPQ